MKRLTIISHTEHYKTSEGQILGLGSTVTEINHLLAIFQEITHIAMLHDQKPPANVLPYVSDRITFVPIPAVGGPKLSDKLSVLLKAPQIIAEVKTHLKTSDWFQFRAPTGIGVFLIPYLLLFKKKNRGWFKYAGNWKQSQAPLGYRFQKWLLLQQSRKVTINGYWEDQASHCLTFENPCLTQDDLIKGQTIIKNKRFDLPIELCFVGRLEAQKGLDLILEAMAEFSEQSSNKIKTVHIVGAGAKSAERNYINRASSCKINFEFYGMLSRTEVHAIFSRSHAILLPSKSEGFPKVISEAMNFGCLPIVSNVSSIGQHIVDGQNGYLLEHLSVAELTRTIERLLVLSEPDYHKLIEQSVAFINQFSYNYYNAQILKKILNK